MPHPPHTPAGKFAALRLRLGQYVGAQTGWGISLLLIKLIIDKVRGIGERFDRLVQRIEAGTFAPRYRAKTPAADPTRETPVPPKRAKSPSPLPIKFGWLRRLVQDTAGSGAALEYLLQDPEMIALLEKAPREFGRILRPLCWMLAVKPPPLIAWPRKPRKPRQPRAPRPKLPRRKTPRGYNAAVPGPPLPKPPRPQQAAPPPQPQPPPPGPAPARRGGLALEYDAWGKPRLVWI